MAARLSPVNDAFEAALAKVAEAGASPQLLAGVRAAIGVPYETPTVDAATFPIVGFAVLPDATTFLVYVLTPGRFIRYEVSADSRSLTVALPLSRVSRVVELTAPSSITVLVELDADAVVSRGEYRESGDDNDPGAAAGVSLSRAERTTYELTATTRERATELATFSLALRSSLGM